MFLRRALGLECFMNSVFLLDWADLTIFSLSLSVTG